MNYRPLGKTGINVSEIALGTWQVGGKWGTSFNNENADLILNKAIDQGINFIDTADVYGEHPGESEIAVGRVVKNRSERIFVATKCGRLLSPHTTEAYQPQALRTFVEASLKRMGLETIDLIQLHCPPTAVYYRPEIFELFDRLKEEGKIQHLGVSVEKVEEAIKAIEYPNVTTVQIIFNIFRQRPSELFFNLAQAKNVGIIVRVPLASGLLTGKFNLQTSFDQGDHRFFNREGAAFDKGETFAGVPYEIGVKAVDEIKGHFPEFSNLAPMALKWILNFPQVSCIIPGASKIEHVESNLQTLNFPSFSEKQHQALNEIYEHQIKSFVHHIW